MKALPRAGTFYSKPYQPRLHLNLKDFNQEVIKMGNQIKRHSKFSQSDEIIENSRLEEIAEEYERIRADLEQKELLTRYNYGGIIFATIALLLIIIAAIALWKIYVKKYKFILDALVKPPPPHDKMAELKMLRDPLMMPEKHA